MIWVARDLGGSCFGWLMRLPRLSAGDHLAGRRPRRRALGQRFGNNFTLWSSLLPVARVLPSGLKATE
ncbi:hypothetical protein Misp01_51860 [Microtetraspora sp. NBRC 13810]|nr:hypothetical protein Misp01_51860 [Microtetraspora sp. NBRC 13810]